MPSLNHRTAPLPITCVDAGEACIGEQDQPFAARPLGSSAHRRRFMNWYWACTALFLLFFRAAAHDVGLSTAEIRCSTYSIRVVVTMAVKDMETLFELDTNGDAKVTPAEFGSSRGPVEKYAAQACLLEINGRSIDPESVKASVDQTNNVDLSFIFPVTNHVTAKITFELIQDLPAGHRTFVTVIGKTGNRLQERLLTRESRELQFSDSGVVGSYNLPSFLGFVKLGIEHIGTGYDHLLFLFALLLVTRNLRSSVAVITCFTLAHSVTLAGATFNIVNLPAKVTEPLIAATILYVGLENIMRKGDPHHRWALTFCFGLVHGFGFASVLRERGVGASGGGVAMPLLGFNLGVEFGQLAVTAVLLPIIWKLRESPVFLRRVIPACSAGIVMLGAYWVIERLLG